PPLPHTRDGCGVMPTSATDWRYDPALAAGSRPSASNWAAMYLAARRPPRVAGARPSSRSSARYFRWASIAVVLTAGRGAARVAGMPPGRDAPAQPTDIIATVIDHFRDTCGHSFRSRLGQRTAWMSPRRVGAASLVSTNVESSRKAIASPCGSSPETLHTGHPLGVRSPPAPGTKVSISVYVRTATRRPSGRSVAPD